MAGGAPDQLDGVRHRGLHADAEHVELEQAELLDVVLVELAHREPGEAGLHGRAVEQRGVRQQHAARVHGDVAGQPVEPLDQAEHQVEPLGVDAAGTQLGQLAQRHPGVAGPDVRERLGDGVDLERRHAEGGADVADGVPDAVGVHHRDAHAPLAAEPVEDRLVDLGPPSGLHVDVDVGQRAAQRREEPLHQQVVPDRVDAGDAEQVVDQAARARPPRRAADPALADQVGDVGDGEEVRRVAEAADQLELVVEPLPDALARGRAVAVTDRPLAPRPQHRVGLVGGHIQVGEVHLAEAEVGARVERAGLRDGAGAGHEPVRVLQAGHPADLLGHLEHLLAGLEEPLGVRPEIGGAEVAKLGRAEGDQPAGRVQDVDGRGVAAVGVADGVGEHGADALAVGEAGHPGGVRGAAGTPVARPARPRAAELVGDQLDVEVPGRDHLAPGGQRGVGEVVVPESHRRPHLRAGTEQHGDVARGQPGREQVEGRDRLPALAGEVHRGDQPADRRPAGAAAARAAGRGEQGDPGQAGPDGVAERAAAGRRPRSGRRPWSTCEHGLVGQVDAEHRPDAGDPAGLGELHRAVGAVAVGQRQGVHLLLGGPLHQDVRVGGAVLEGVAGRDAEVDEGVH